MNSFTDKVVLVTGGTGSFGKAVARLLLSRGVGEVRVFSRDEEKQDLMRGEFDGRAVKYFIGDVRDRHSVDQAMNGVDLVFHAAALKQVPSCEFFPMQAILTNVVGSSNVVESAIAHSVSKVVCLGTDKAVFPINAMGMSKALMEKVVQASARNQGDSRTILSSVRYGNVMMSRGSVIPLFIRQLRQGQQVTLTHSEMTRFLMPMGEAVDLVLHALANARQGDTFIRKAPASTIGDLAEAVQQLFGIRAGVRVIGVRHGEKMFETLVSAEELTRSEDMGDYYRVSMDGRSLDYGRFFTDGDPEIASHVDFDSNNARRLTVAGVVELLRTVPEIASMLSDDSSSATRPATAEN